MNKMDHDLCHVVYNIDILGNCDNVGVGGSLNGCVKKNFYTIMQSWALIKANSLGQFSNAILNS